MNANEKRKLNNFVGMMACAIDQVKQLDDNVMTKDEFVAEIFKTFDNAVKSVGNDPAYRGFLETFSERAKEFHKEALDSFFEDGCTCVVPLKQVPGLTKEDVIKIASVHYSAERMFYDAEKETLIFINTDREPVYGQN